jgi:hypothetical protein
VWVFFDEELDKPLDYFLVGIPALGRVCLREVYRHGLEFGPCFFV